MLHEESVISYFLMKFDWSNDTVKGDPQLFTLHTFLCRDDCKGKERATLSSIPMASKKPSIQKAKITLNLLGTGLSDSIHAQWEMLCSNLILIFPCRFELAVGHMVLARKASLP